MNLQKLCLSTFFLLMAGTASAAISTGYYRIKSNAYEGRYMGENYNSHQLYTTTDFSATDYSLVWYITANGNNVTIKNALTNRFVQKQGTFSALYSTGTTSTTFTASETGSTYTFADATGAGLHCSSSQSYNVVHWYTNADASVWQLESATVDQTVLDEQKAALKTANTTQLNQFFTSTACTELKSTYTSYSDDDLRTAMSALPTSVQELAVKIKNDSWTTYSGWDKTEKTFRIADYKAYSSHTRWTGIIGLGYNFGCLTNPTGISVSKGEYLQVYVGAIPSSQTVYLEVAGENQSSGTTYTLQRGMNVLPMLSSGNCFVQYEVDNTTSGGTPYKALSNYADVTVHIEGGTVNGYFDLTKGDDNDDWTQLQKNLLKGGTTVELKTSNLLFHMTTSLVKSACPKKMVELLGEWDKILNMIYSLMGLEEFDGFWNNMLSATDVTSNYMYATTYGTYYETSTISSVMSYADLFAGGALWGPAHENGHLFQKYINMVGQTEVSNNLFSNVAIYNNGHLTSRASNISATFKNMANNVFWNDRGIWERTHLYFQLYQFFHILGRKSDFYPELFKALRSDPMTHTKNTFISATDDYLKFYKKCCSVSGYDLTEFFQAYGFFVIPTLTSYTLNGVTKDAYMIGDYGDFYLTVTQAEIDAAKQAVAKMNLPKANVIFIEDRITTPAATYEGAAASAKKTAFSNEYPIGKAGETGQYTDYDAECSAYTFNVDSKGHVTVSGTGAVGFVVYNANGDAAGFYNTYSFTLPSGIGTGYTIQAAAGDGTMVVAVKDPSLEVIVTEFPLTDKWYSIRSLRGSRYLLSNGVGKGVVGTTNTTMTAAKQWRFETRTGESESFDIINRNDGSYLDPTTEWNTQMKTTADQPSTGWRVEPASTTGKYIITTGSAQLNQTTNSGTNGNKVYNWGGGSNTSDEGCQFTITAVDDYDVPIQQTLSDMALEELEDFDIKVSSTAAASLTTGQWYVMFDRGTDSGNHGYLYEKVSSHTLYNTATAPSGSATEACKYLVRLLDAGDSKHYIQTGYGNYFGQIEAKTNVPVIATQSQRVTVAKINNTDGHFYLQGETGGVILDANDLSKGDATVVGWGTTVPTTLNGNNDWAFYPVTLIYNGTEVAIHDSQRQDKTANGIFFDLSGRRVNKPTKGIYIVRSTRSGASHLKNSKKAIIR